jgi:hypothetical protein
VCTSGSHISEDYRSKNGVTLKKHAVFITSSPETIDGKLISLLLLLIEITTEAVDILREYCYVSIRP